MRLLRPNGKNFSGRKEHDSTADAFRDYHEPNLTGKGLVPYTERDFRDEHDGLDPAQKDRRNELFGISSLRGKYVA